ncbi:metallophosphoesterase [Candidatus Woesearchaeota archaeon]|nr:metallophosphoesterase [Candidatus Woesearchaeota archaeon]
MKILAAGDIHGDRSLAEKLAKQAETENVDLVILCGDLTHFEQSTEGIIGPFIKKGQRVVILPGNHETLATADFLAELYNIKNLHGYYLKYKDLGIFGCGGANIGPLSKLTEEEILYNLKKGFRGVKNLKKKVMVTHVHPDKGIMARFVPGSSGVRKAIEEFKPDILICSHVHEAEGLEDQIGSTKVINVSKSGKILEI